MIHPTAIIGDEVTLGQDVAIGPYCVLEGRLRIGDGSRLGPHVHISGFTTIGAEAEIHAGAVIGDEPQDIHYKGEESYTQIGDRCVIREYVTIHRGADAGSTTVIGNGVMLMGLSHVAHNCHLEDHVIVANGSLLAGHVHVGRRAFLSGGVMVHQFCRIGTMAMVHGGERITQDVPPFAMMAEGGIRGPNTVGLRRAGIAPEARKAIKQAMRIYFAPGANRSLALEEIRRTLGGIPEVALFVDFAEVTKRGLVPGRGRPLEE